MVGLPSHWWSWEWQKGMSFGNVWFGCNFQLCFKQSVFYKNDALHTNVRLSVWQQNQKVTILEAVPDGCLYLSILDNLRLVILHCKKIQNVQSTLGTRQGESTNGGKNQKDYISITKHKVLCNIQKENKQRGPHGWYDHSSPCGVDLAPLVLIDCLSVLSMVSPPGSLVPWWLGLGWQPVPGHGITKQFEDYNLVSTCLVLTDTQSECIQDTTASSHCQKIWWTRLLSCYVVSCRAQHVFWLSARGSRMQQVFWNLPTRTRTHVWEILGNPVNPAGVNLDVPFFPTCATPGDLSATISPQFFIEF